MREGWSAAEVAAIDKALATPGKLIRTDPPPPLPDLDQLAREFAERELKPVSRRGPDGELPEDLIKMIRDADGLYSREAIADRFGVTVATVRQILGPTPAGRRKVTEAMRQEILKARGKESIISLATRLGIGQASVCRVYQAAGLTTPGKRLRTDQKVDREKVIQARGSAPLHEIAARFGISRALVSRIYRQAGISGTSTNSALKSRRRRPDEIHPEEEAAILALRGTMSRAAIARQFGRHPRSIARVFERVDRRKAEVVAGVRTRTPPGSPPERRGRGGEG